MAWAKINNINLNTTKKFIQFNPSVTADDFPQLKPSKELGDAIYNIANRLGFAPNFINYTYKEEMIGDAIVKMLYALNNKKFSAEKGNAFPYFTTIAYNAFINRIKKEKKSREALVNYQNDMYDNLIDIGDIPSDQGQNQNNTDQDM